MAPVSYTVDAPIPTTYRPEEYADKQQVYEQPTTATYGYSNDIRPSLEVYGSFDGDIPRTTGEEPSRTMQLAYNDPCE